MSLVQPAGMDCTQCPQATLLTKVFYILVFEKIFHEDALFHVLDKPWKFHPDWFSHIGDHRERTTGFALPQTPLPGPSALDNCEAKNLWF